MRGNFVDRLIWMLRAGYPCVAIRTAEDRSAGAEIIRAAKTIADLAKAAKRPTPQDVKIWSFPVGFEAVDFDGQLLRASKPVGQGDPTKALQAIESWLEDGNDSVFVMQDLDIFLGGKDINRSQPLRTFLKRVIRKCEACSSKLILTGTSMELPDIVGREISVVDYELPGEEDLRKTVDAMIASFNNGAGDYNPSQEERQSIALTLRGLTELEAKNALAMCLVSKKELDIEVLTDAKAEAISRDGIVQYYKPDIGMGDVGGLDLLKQWIHERELAFTPAAREFGLPQPKGLLMLGIPGCGKSLTAKAVAKMMRLPLLRLDMGSVFGGLVGESEGNMRRAIATAEAMSPCVLWADELEKAFAGVGGGSTDGGTTQRVFGTFLTWMQEKKSPVFVVGTANNVQSLPAEMLRRGRWDELFYIDLPHEEEREDIFRIHLSKRGREFPPVAIAAFARDSEGFSGAEIEQAVIEAMHTAFFIRTLENKKRDLEPEDVFKALKGTKTLAQTMHEQISAMREWAEGRARPASSPLSISHSVVKQGRSFV